MDIHWKAPIQAKGFLKILEMVIALLALSLVAGFSVTHSVDCSKWGSSTSNAYANVSTAVKYPFHKATSDVYIHAENSNISHLVLVNKLPSSYMQSAQFFVVWGVFSIFYGIIAIAVYMLTTANARMEWIVNYLVLTDLIFHVVWVLCWLIASIDWAAAQVSMNKYLSDIVLKHDALQDDCIASVNNDSGSYVQAAIADVFGFTSFVLWGLNIYWIVLDTSFYLEWRSKHKHSVIDDYGRIDD